MKRNNPAQITGIVPDKVLEDVDKVPTHRSDSQTFILVPGRLLRIKQFIPGILPIAVSTFWAGVKSGKYPKPIKLSERVTCWKSEDIIALLKKDEVNHAARHHLTPS